MTNTVKKALKTIASFDPAALAADKKALRAAQYILSSEETTFYVDWNNKADTLGLAFAAVTRPYRQYLKQQASTVTTEAQTIYSAAKKVNAALMQEIKGDYNARARQFDTSVPASQPVAKTTVKPLNRRSASRSAAPFTPKQ